MTLSLWPDEPKKEIVPPHKRVALVIKDFADEKIEELVESLGGGGVGSESCFDVVVGQFNLVIDALDEIIYENAPDLECIADDDDIETWISDDK